MSLTLTGIGVSRGIAIGKVHIVRRGQPDIPEYRLSKAQRQHECERLQTAFHVAGEQLNTIRDNIPRDTPCDIAAFIDTHLLMLQDDALSETAERLIQNQGCNAEWALKQQRDVLVDVFDRMDDPYLRTRKDDIDHVVNRVLGILLQQEQHPALGGRGMHLQGHIILADDLTPADMVLLQDLDIAAFITEYGGPLSHTAILARSLSLPAIVGIHDTLRRIHDGAMLIVDGEQGRVIVSPDKATLRRYRQQQRDDRQQLNQLKKLKHKAAITLDGREIQLHANIELPEDLAVVKGSGATGVGLFRTEFLYMNRSDMPSEKEQYRVYRQMVRHLKGKPLTIRTLDLGADKALGGDVKLQTNPALGLRAIRLCLRDPDLFRPQLRAILRASAHGPVRLMIPMLSHLSELRQLRHLLDEIKAELRDEQSPYDKKLPLGGMVEVPAAALAARQFARQLDFLSIGTNDLIQYTLAIDRTDDEVNYLFDPLHPGVLRLIEMTLQAGRKAGIPVSMCGEMAGDPRYTRLLLGLGLSEFSMQPAAIPEIKHRIRNSDTRLLRKKVRRIINSHDPEQALRLLHDLNQT